MSKFQVGQQVVRTKHRYGDFKKGQPYVVTKLKEFDDHSCIEVEGFPDGTLWDEDYFDLYQEPAQKTFNPKHGDVIVTEGEGNWVCVDKTDSRYFGYQDYDFIGVNDYGFTAWMANGNAHRGYNPAPHIYDKFRIKEIIPASSNNSVAIPQENPDLSFKVKTLELENQMLRKLLRREGVEV